MSSNYLGDGGKKAVKQGRDSGHKQKKRWERNIKGWLYHRLTDRCEVIDYTHLLKFPQVLCSDSQIDVAESILLTNPLTVYVVVLLLASFLPNLLTF